MGLFVVVINNPSREATENGLETGAILCIKRTYSPNCSQTVRSEPSPRLWRALPGHQRMLSPPAPVPPCALRGSLGFWPEQEQPESPYHPDQPPGWRAETVKDFPWDSLFPEILLPRKGLLKKRRSSGAPAGVPRLALGYLQREPSAAAVGPWELLPARSPKQATSRGPPSSDCGAARWFPVVTLRRGDWWKFEAAQLRKPIEASQRDSKSQRARTRLSWERGDGYL